MKKTIFIFITVLILLSITFSYVSADCVPQPPTPPGCTNDFGSHNPCNKEKNDCSNLIGSTSNEPVQLGHSDPNDTTPFTYMDAPTEEPIPEVGTIIYDVEGNIIAWYPGVTDLAEIESGKD